MPLYTNNCLVSLLPFEVGEPVYRPFFDASVSLRTPGVHVTTNREVRWPVIVSDSSSAVTQEGQEIAPSDLTTAELTSVPTKIASLVISSSEAISDGDGIAEIIAASVTRSLGAKLDQAVFNTVSGFGGLGAVTGATTISAGASWADTNPFIEGVYAAANYGVDVECWVANPADALTLALIEDGDGSKTKLLNPVPSESGVVTTVSGIPILTSPAVPAGTIYGINSTYCNIVLRQNIEVSADASVLYTSDRIAYRGSVRAAVAVNYPETLIKLKLGS